MTCTCTCVHLLPQFFHCPLFASGHVMQGMQVCSCTLYCDMHVRLLPPFFHCRRPLFASGHVMQGMQVCLRSKISWASEREISCEIDHTESSERSEAVRVGSERFFSLSLERQRSACEMASFGRYAPPSVLDRKQKF